MMEELLIYFPYIGILLLLILGGVGLPFPEDLTLILAGQLALTQGLSFPLLFLICFVGVVSMDLFLFYIGKKYYRMLFRYRLYRQIFTPPRRVQVKKYFRKYGDAVVFIARFIGGFRAPVFIKAGNLQMSYARFLFLDISASLLSIPMFVLGSYHLGKRFEEVAHGLTTKITLGLMGLIAIIFTYAVIKGYIESKKQSRWKISR